MTLHNAPGPILAAVNGLVVLVVAILVLIGVLVALAHRYTVCRCGQAEDDA